MRSNIKFFGSAVLSLFFIIVLFGCGGGGGSSSDGDAVIGLYPPNSAPSAVISPPDGSLFEVGESINFDGSGSSDPDGYIVSYLWDFGDGSTSTQVSPTDHYTTARNYTVTLTVKDDGGASGTASISIEITAVEQGSISGSVRDAVSDSPLEGVTVDVYSDSSLITSGTTDSSGVHSLLVPVGSGYEVEFSMAGYIPVSYHNVSVEADTTTYLETVLQIDSAYSGTGNVSGTIYNAFDTSGVSGLTVSLREGINATSGSFVASTTTGYNGSYSFSDLNAGSYTAQVSGSGFNTTYFTVICIGGTTTANQDASTTPIFPSGETRIILTWGQTPSDLDSHMTGPIPGSYNRFHIYFWSKGSSTSSPYAELDLDDTTGYGPETTTIYQQFDGTYRYSVHNYTDRDSASSLVLSNSNAQVRVYWGSNLVATFHVPSNQYGTLWTVFELDEDSITPINTMSYESDPVDITSAFHERFFETDAPLMTNLPPKD